LPFKVSTAGLVDISVLDGSLATFLWILQALKRVVSTNNKEVKVSMNVLFILFHLKR